jgi:UDP-GlcNAc:undecaprenyl-phosphate GlcNAc-1-phosphate transferase
MPFTSALLAAAATQPAAWGERSLSLSVDDVLSPYVFVFYASFLVAFVFTPVMRLVALHYDIVDRPDKLRKMHAQPVAYLGGVAVFLGWISGVALSKALSLHFYDDAFAKAFPALMPTSIQIPRMVVLGACVIVALGLWDDKWGVSPRVKILGQGLAAVMLLGAGIGGTVTAPFVNAVVERVEIRTGLEIAPAVTHWIVNISSAGFTMGLVIFCCNAANLMDGLDGLCGGVTSIIAVGFLMLAVHLACNSEIVNSNTAGLRVVLGLALLGAVLGFVPFNFNPASIFMGDTGSMFLGFACALAIIMLSEVGGKWMLAGLVMFSLPVLDTALAFGRRWVNGRPLFSADKFHFHHQLVQRGLSVRQAVLTAYGLSIFFVLCGLAIMFMRTRYAVAFYLVIFGCIIVAAYKMGMVHERPATVKRSGLDADEVARPPETAEGVISIEPGKANGSLGVAGSTATGTTGTAV